MKLIGGGVSEGLGVSPTSRGVPGVTRPSAVRTALATEGVLISSASHGGVVVVVVETGGGSAFATVSASGRVSA
jgi:hypothetical protein